MTRIYKHWYIQWLMALLVIIIGCSPDDSGPNDPPSVELPNKLYDVTASTIQGINHFPDVTPLVKYDVSVFKLTYSTFYKGTATTVSGVVVIPNDVVNPSIIVDCHGTVQSDSEIPSNSNVAKPLRFTQLAATGYIVFAPDYIGFGESINDFHPWLITEPGAQVVVNMVISGRKFLDDYKVSYSDKIFLTGYSEGSNFVLAAQRNIESQPELDINLIASAPASGAYDMEMTFSRRVGGKQPTEAIGAAYLILAFRDYYNWQNPLTDFFKEAYATEFNNILQLPGNFEDNIFGTPNQVLNDFINGTLSQDSLLTDAFREDLTSAQRKIFNEKLTENNIHNWKPTIPTTLYYGKSDYSTYFENSINAYDSFISNGADPNMINIVGFEGKDHDSAESPSMRAALDWFGAF